MMMMGRVVLVVGLIVAAGQTTTVWGLDLLRTKTEARNMDPASANPPIQLNLQADLSDGVPDLAAVEVVASWEQVGGIQPTPFKVVIPQGCFVSNRGFFHVAQFRRCGVSMEFNRSPMSIIDFGARMVTGADGRSRLEVRALFMVAGGTPPDDTAPAILSTLGGAAVAIAIGRESAHTVPLEIESLSGITPCI